MAKSFDELVQHTMSKKRQAEAAARARELLAEVLLSEIRDMVSMSPREVAKILGIKQPTLSKFAKPTDIPISALQHVVKTLGGKLEVTATFPNGTIKIDRFDRPSNKPKRRRSVARSV